MTTYFDPTSGASISENQLQASPKKIQKGVLEAWFRQHYEDPAERTPYESAEGGYMWIWGGPFDAREEIEGEFHDLVPESLIEEIVEELQNECWEWAPMPSSSDYDEYLVADIAKITTYYHTLSGAILDIESLLSVAVPGPAGSCYFRLLYVNVITALETYLSDAFISTVVNDQELMRRFIETTPEFKSEKIALADVFKASENVGRRAKSYLADVVWHHLERVKPMYMDTLGVEFPQSLGSIFRAIHKRHDIVHRNGKTKDGDEILINADDIKQLISEVQAFASSLDSGLRKRKEAEDEGDDGSIRGGS